MRSIIAFVVLLAGNVLFAYEINVWIKAGGIPDVINAMLLMLGFNMSAWMATLIAVDSWLHQHKSS